MSRRRAERSRPARSWSRWWRPAAAALLITGCAVAVFRAQSAPPAAAPVASSAAPTSAVALPARIRWEPGALYRYRLHWTLRTEATLPGMEQAGRLPGELEVEADLVLRSSGSDAGSRLVATLEEVKTERFALTGQPLQSPSGALSGAVGVVKIDERGRVVFLGFPRETSDFARRVLAPVLLALHVGLPDRPAPEWSELQRTMLGEQWMTYRAPHEASAPIARRHDRYESVTAGRGRSTVRGSGALTFANEGHLTKLTDHETTSVQLAGAEASSFTADSTLELELGARERLEAGSPAPDDQSLDVWDASHAARSSPFDVSIAKSFAEGLTVDQMALAILDKARGLAMPRGTLVKMVGLVRSDPIAARSLVALFAREDLGPAGRAMVADVLASAGTPDAQDVLRRLLAWRGSKLSPAERSVLLQRFSLLSHPTRESAAFVWSEHEHATASGELVVARATLASIGAIVFHLYADKEDEAAARYETQLLKKTEAARAVDDVEAALAGLGNTRSARGLPAVLAHRAHPSVDVRSQVAMSLRHLTEPEARAALLDLIADPSVEVASGAVGAFGTQTLTKQDLEDLAERVVTDRVNLGAYGPLRTLLMSQHEPKPPARRILGHMLAHATDPEQKANIALVLKDLGD